MDEKLVSALTRATINSLYDADEVFRRMLQKYVSIYVMSVILGKEHMIVVNSTLGKLGNNLAKMLKARKDGTDEHSK